MTAHTSVLAPAARYDGVAPFPEPGIVEGRAASLMRTSVTLALVIAPLIGLVAAAVLAWGRMFSVADVALAVAFYLLTGFGITLGFHRGLTHRAFRMRRPVQLILVTAGSMAFEGAVIDWVATHRRHHAFTDRPGDPHSPYRYGTSFTGQLRGLFYAHVGWLRENNPTSATHYAPDLVRDPMLRRLDAAFPLLCTASLALPFALGVGITRTFVGGLTALVWAGLARVALLQHVTWSVNSLCHMLGTRPYRTREFDRATNLWPLALLSLGESWHNGHHADPSCARHGRARGQVDPSAALIRALESFSLVHKVHWPTSLPDSRAPQPAAASVPDVSRLATDARGARDPGPDPVPAPEPVTEPELEPPLPPEPLEMPPPNRPGRF
jgi:stearoyl-CoA desaturase (Delta-9 desaturase)